MKASEYKNYDDLALFLNVAMAAQVLGISAAECDLLSQLISRRDRRLLLLAADQRSQNAYLHLSYNTIATATGMSKNTALKSISTLLESGFIKCGAKQLFR